MKFVTSDSSKLMHSISSTFIQHDCGRKTFNARSRLVCMRWQQCHVMRSGMQSLSHSTCQDCSSNRRHASRPFSTATSRSSPLICCNFRSSLSTGPILYERLLSVVARKLALHDQVSETSIQHCLSQSKSGSKP